MTKSTQKRFQVILYNEKGENGITTEHETWDNAVEQMGLIGKAYPHLSVELVDLEEEK